MHRNPESVPYHRLVAWDRERTRRLLLDAAAGEFASHGLAGGRIERISSEAGVNRERIYSYFGSKLGLFEAVLSDRLDSALDGVGVTGVGVEAIGRFAVEYFDAVTRDPTLARLVAWEGLERRDVVDIEDRSARANRVIDELRSALPGAARSDVEDLFLTIVTLSYCWLVIPNLARVVGGDPVDPHRRRRALEGQAVAMAVPLTLVEDGVGPTGSAS
jgi:AcrR family transcriptional regulator